MRVAIYAEGKSDLAVIRNILKGQLNIDMADIKNDLPELEYDETDLALMGVKHFSTWTIVKEHCQKREKINEFLATFEQERFIIIQLDAFERNQIGFEVIEPIKGSLDDNLYSETVYRNVSDKINEWMEGEYINCSVHAITIEELEAWLLPIYEPAYQYDTSRIPNPKDRFNNVINKVLSKKERQILKLDVYNKFLKLSWSFRKKKNLILYGKKNRSLEIFCEHLKAFEL